MRLLALVDSPDHVCCRYRIRAFEPALMRAGWSLSCQSMQRGTLARINQLAQAALYDSVILQRKLLPAWQLAILRRHSRHLVFDFDDAVLFRDSYDRRGPHSAWRQRRFTATVRAADAVIAGNDFLADCALRAGAPAERVRLIPTCVTPGSYPLLPSGYARHGGSTAVDLVWIGSSSTLRGLEQERPLWEQLGREVHGLRLRVICNRFPSFHALRVIPVTWCQESEAAELAAGHIGVSWLPDDEWSRGKCGLKVLQYQAAGLPVIANPVGMNTELIEPGITGFLPSSAQEWVEAVRALASDPPRRRDMGQMARNRVELGYSTEAWAGTFVSSVAGMDLSDRGEGGTMQASRPGPIPDPFFVRLRGVGVYQRNSRANELTRSRKLD
jgi:glycosyltransferase involved in cell wall biosynthesis